ncbi:MAG TPA: hypothetical protein VJ746_16085 [Nitrospira sp.]|nr:hypothetical protein [Nitrospira sp.]
MEQWISKQTLVWLSVGSGVGLIIGALAVPWVVATLPEDYFSDPSRQSWLDRQPAAVRVPVRIGKNLLAVVLIVLGVAMLVLPGQGILSILLGVVLADFPGKLTLQRRILGRPKVMDSVNWLRRKMGRPPFHIPSGSRSN